MTRGPLSAFAFAWAVAAAGCDRGFLESRHALLTHASRPPVLIDGSPLEVPAECEGGPSSMRCRSAVLWLAEVSAGGEATVETIFSEPGRFRFTCAIGGARAECVGWSESAFRRRIERVTGRTLTAPQILAECMSIADATPPSGPLPLPCSLALDVGVRTPLDAGTTLRATYPPDAKP